METINVRQRSKHSTTAERSGQQSSLGPVAVAALVGDTAVARLDGACGGDRRGCLHHRIGGSSERRERTIGAIDRLHLQAARHGTVGLQRELWHLQTALLHVEHEFLQDKTI